MAYDWYSGVAHSLSAIALPATADIIGPPCIPGKTALSIAAACSALVKIIPPRGPRNTLCVVNETTSAYGTGEGIALPATSPMKCAASTHMMAPTSSQISRTFLKSIKLG
ncbi:unannotated protein [freshwater metagenome]|uniref:Unannotated protein n=1 Tax=freshwater metagenome TaxID=449393 RepID=A0A6J6LKU4_9ZZZZ